MAFVDFSIALPCKLDISRNGIANRILWPRADKPYLSSPAMTGMISSGRLVVSKRGR